MILKKMSLKSTARTIIIVFTCCSFIFCHRSFREESNSQVALIKPDLSSASIFDVASATSQLQFIPLETNASSLVGEIKKIVLSGNGEFFISDTRDVSRILVFNSNGDYQKSFKRDGNGPGEYSRIDDFNITLNGALEILDGRMGRLFTYSLANDSLINEERLPFFASKFYRLNGESIVFYKNHMANPLEDEKYFFDLILVDNHYEVIDRATPYFLVQGRSEFSISRNQVFTGDSEQIFYSDIDSDTIFEITSNEIAEKYFIDYGSSKLDLSSKTFSSAIEKMNYIFNNSHNKVALTFYVYKNSNKLLISFPFQNKPYLTIYNRESKSAKTYSSLYDSVYFKWTVPPPKYSDQGTLITVLDINFAQAFLAEANTNIEPAIYNMLLEIEKGLSNPIIITYKLL